MHGEAWVNKAIQEADLIIALGMRFDDRVTGNLKTYALNAKKIHVELDPAEINKNVRVDLPLLGDVREILRLINPHWLMIGLLVSWAGDTAALYVGRAFGRHKLAPRVSPSKTWEGSVGSVAGGVLATAIYAHYLIPTVAPWAVLAVGAAGNIAGQVGDLCESAFKRGAGVKDSGTTLPGHGGWLDRIDPVGHAPRQRHALLDHQLPARRILGHDLQRALVALARQLHAHEFEAEGGCLRLDHFFQARGIGQAQSKFVWAGPRGRQHLSLSRQCRDGRANRRGHPRMQAYSEGSSEGSPHSRS